MSAHSMRRTADSDGNINILVDAEATIRVTAKKYGYMDKHVSFDVADTKSMPSRPHT